MRKGPPIELRGIPHASRADGPRALVQFVAYVSSLVISDEDLARFLAKSYRDPGRWRKRELTAEQRKIVRTRYTC